MSAKSLGTLPVIYAVDEQQNPLPRKTMLCGGDTNSTGGENGVFQRSLGPRLSIQHYITGEGGSQLLFLQRNRTGVENSYHCMGIPRTFGRHCRLGTKCPLYVNNFTSRSFPSASIHLGAFSRRKIAYQSLPE